MDQLSCKEWKKIFDEAQKLGISFVLLAGGEPLLRWDVIQEAAKNPDILFPVFTNGTFIGGKYLDMFDRHRNLIPVISIEGNKEKTDSRRGEGVYDKLITAMDGLCERDLIFGTSVTVTSENLKEVTSDAQRDDLISELSRIRSDHQDMVFVSFPGDEKSSGGFIAAGRGFFHINSHGGAEPCPFSPYSDTNVRDTSLREALRSKLFTRIIEEDMLADDHKGGCVLFEKRKQVEAHLAALGG